MSIIKEGPYGGDGGKPFSLQDFTSIVKIGVAYTVDGTNSNINGITIHYTVNGVEKPSVTFGGPGKENPEFELQPGEFITSIKGHYGKTPDDDWNGVRELTFKTSNNYTYGPYGNEVGTEFELPANNGSFNGFFGRAETRLDKLGAYVKINHIGGSTGTGF